MIALEKASIGGPRGRLVLGPVSLELGPGAHAFVGAAHEGGPALLAALGGAVRLRSGKVTTDAPSDAIVYVPAAPLLPAGLTTREIVTLSARLRGETEARDALAAYGIQALAHRRADTLTHAEAHAVALVCALESKAAVLLVEEPFAHLDPRAAPAIVERLRALAASGTTLVVATASERDARALGADVWSVRGGLCVRRAPPAFADLAKLRGFAIRVDDPERLSAALAERAHVEVEGGALVVRGDDALTLATAITAAIADTGVRAFAIEPLDARTSGRAKESAR